MKYTTKPNFGTLALMAATAGASGAFIGTPAEVVLVRMTSDGRLPKGYLNYSIIYHFYYILELFIHN